MIWCLSVLCADAAAATRYLGFCCAKITSFGENEFVCSAASRFFGTMLKVRCICKTEGHCIQFILPQIYGPFTIDSCFYIKCILGIKVPWLEVTIGSFYFVKY